MSMKRKTEESDTLEAQVLKATEVARWLRIPKSTLYKLCQEARFPAKKVGRHWRFDQATLEKWLVTQRGDE